MKISKINSRHLLLVQLVSLIFFYPQRIDFKIRITKKIYLDTLLLIDKNPTLLTH